MSVSEFTQQDYDLIARDFADLKEAAIKRCSNSSEIDVIQRAFEFANAAHKNVRRRSGEPYMIHPIAVAKIVVSDIGLGYKSITAALLHDVVEDTDFTVEDISRMFGEKIASLVDGLTKIKTVLDNQDKNHLGGDVYIQSLQAENFKRILLTLNDDARVVLIKLADRLHNCRTIEFMPEYKRDKILSETMFIFIPLAHRLGLYEVKAEMENIWLRYKEPAAYNEITALINRTINDKDESIEAFIRPIDEALTKAGMSYGIRKRIKTPYSIWHKMTTKNVAFDQIYDLYAVRIVFDVDAADRDRERDECYHIFSIVTGIYRYKPDRVRDWVNHPKSNGYEALHCTLLSNDGIWIELQIRSRRMDDIAEKGIAAHWAYKKEGYLSEKDSEVDKWLNGVKEILVNPDVNALELLDIVHSDLVSSEITVFTPKGEQKTIAKGSTALDFAYSIHSHIGNTAIAAKVNMKLVPLSYVLKTGDQVEIITSEDEHPKKEWLQFLHTRQAKSIVMDYFKADKNAIVMLGKMTLEEKLKGMGMKLTESGLRRLVAATGQKNSEELFFRLALGLVHYETLIEILTNIQAHDKSKWYTKIFKGSAEKEPVAPKKNRMDYVISSNDKKHRYVLATCCNPIAGDPVLGFLSPDGTIAVHKKTCEVAQSMASKYGDWIVMPQWADSKDISFVVRVSIKGVDHMGMLNEITRMISLVMEVNIKRLNLGTEKGLFDGYIDLEVQDTAVLENLIKKLKNIDGVQSVMRTEI